MRKKICVAALALSLALEPIAGVYGADFSSGSQETVIDTSSDSVFFSVEDEPEDTFGDIVSDEEQPEPADQDVFFGDVQEDGNSDASVTEFPDTEIFTASEGEQEVLSTVDFQYTLNGGEAVIVRYLGNAEVVEIPEKIGEYPVTGIGEDVFAGGTVKQVTLHEEIANIHENAFASCTELTIYCYEGSYAQVYASEKNIPCELLEAKKKDITAAVVTMAASAVCTGKALTPAVTVSYEGTTLINGQDYSLTYADNINPGTANVTITGMGEYEGTIPKTFKITLATPQLVSAASASYRSIKVTWKAVPGAQSYNIYYKGGTTKSWKMIKKGAAGTSYVHTSSTAYPLATGTKYTYTVRAVYGSSLSGYEKTGKSAKPTLDTVKLGKVTSSAYNKLKITWTKVAGANGYYIYRKSGSSWQKIGKTTGTSYIHTGSTKYPIQTGATYTYTVRAVRKVGTKYVGGGYSKTGVKGKTIPGKPELVNVECTDSGKITIRWKKVPGATNYLVYRKNTKGKWQLIKNVSGANMIGYTHVSSSKFPIVTGKTYTYTVRSYTTTGKTYGLYDVKGKTVKAQTATELQNAAALNNAKKVVAQVTNSAMSSSQKLQACFNWVISKPYVTRRTFANTPGWPAVYANDHFVLGGGNCHSDAAAFAYLAKALGYTNVYVCTDSTGARGAGHSWAEVNGLVYDPLFAEAKNYSRYYGVSYRTYELHPILHIAI